MPIRLAHRTLLAHGAVSNGMNAKAEAISFASRDMRDDMTHGVCRFVGYDNADHVLQNCALAANAQPEELAVFLELVEPFAPGINHAGEGQWTPFWYRLCCA